MLNDIKQLVFSFPPEAKNQIFKYLCLIALLICFESFAAWVLYSKTKLQFGDANLIIIIFICFVFFIFLYFISLNIALSGASIAKETSAFLLNSFLLAPLSHSKKYEEVSVRIIDFANRLNEGVLLPAMQLLGRVVSSLIISILLFIIDPKMFILFFTSIMIFYFLNFLSTRPLIEKYGKISAKKLQKRFTLLSKIYATATEIFYAGGSNKALLTYRKVTKDFYEARAKLQIFPIIPRFILDSVLISFSLMHISNLFSLQEISPVLWVVVIRLISNFQMIYGYVSAIKSEKVVIFEINKFRKDIETAVAVSLKKSCKKPKLKIINNSSLEKVMHDVAKNNGLRLRDQAKQADNCRLIALTGQSGVGKSTFLLNLAEELAKQNRVYYQSSIITTYGDSLEKMKAWGFGKEDNQPAAQKRIKIAEKICFDKIFSNQTLPAGSDKNYIFSTGQRQKIQIFRALSSASDIYLLDEPTSALDHESVEKLFYKLDRFSKTFKCFIILVTHNINVKHCKKFKVERNTNVSSI